MNRKELPTEFLYGGDYNPEQWPREIWLEDAKLMKRAGVNLVSVAIFSWAHLEPRQGDFEFNWLDDVISILADHGVNICLATAVASPPPWFSKMYPNSRPVDSKGVRLEVGSRQLYCPSSLELRRHAGILISRIAHRYSQNQAVRLWHINNEYACHIRECFCDLCEVHFREWLQNRYRKIDELNKAWGTAFWSQRYDNFNEIHPPRNTPAYKNPSQHLDWQRFSSDNLLDLMQSEIAEIRKVNLDVPVVTNFMGFHKPLDYFKWAKYEDITADDSYPDPFDTTDIVGSSMRFDLLRSLKKQRFILMEQAPSGVNWRSNNGIKPPGLMRLISHQAIAHGSRGIMFFQWRASKAGAEKFHSGMVPHAGPDTRTFREVCALGAELKKIEFLTSTKITSRVAVLFDWESWWALEMDAKPSAGIRMIDQVTKYYRALRILGLNVDFVHPEANMEGYAVIVAPNLYLVSDAAVDNINLFVKSGGTLVLGFFSGIVDPNDHIRLGGYPSPFRSTLGLWVEEFSPLKDGDTRKVKLWDGSDVYVRLWCDILHLEGAEMLGTFDEDFFKGHAAITRKKSGEGIAYYIAADFSSEVLQKLFIRVCSEANVPHTVLPFELDVSISTSSQGDVLHLLNFGKDEINVKVPNGSFDVLTGGHCGEIVKVPPIELKLLRFEKSVQINEVVVV
ncbi:hypothetical protein HK096_003955 [Nowakowskiella sp. JEL0078]|nr:hypothetical protein HK096_003955 [Nowakowskiella sp. JEL0078]